MTTVLKVLRFDENRMCSICKIISTDDPSQYVGREFWVDLTVNADLGDMFEQELVGKTVEVDRFQPFEMIGVGVKIVDEQEAQP